jgi:tRNA (guanine37-N1)-methyltransferase
VIHFDILTILPAMFTGPLTESILKRAQASGLLSVTLHNIRDYAIDRHKSVDDYPFGGGAGMVMRADVLYAALAAVLAPAPPEKTAQDDTMAVRPPVIYLSPDGERFDQRIAHELAGLPRIVLICGHYEGVDERVRDCCFDRELSIGDYVLTGGELAAMVVVDAVSRLQPGVLAGESTLEESHSGGLLEYPQYTRPAVWRERPVPDVLVSGHHGRVAAWRYEQRLRRTLERRPDLLSNVFLSEKDRQVLEELGWKPPDYPPHEVGV